VKALAGQVLAFSVTVVRTFGPTVSVGVWGRFSKQEAWSRRRWGRCHKDPAPPVAAAFVLLLVVVVIVVIVVVAFVIGVVMILHRTAQYRP